MSQAKVDKYKKEKPSIRKKERKIKKFFTNHRNL